MVMNLVCNNLQGVHRARWYDKLIRICLLLAMTTDMLITWILIIPALADIILETCLLSFAKSQQIRNNGFITVYFHKEKFRGDSANKTQQPQWELGRSYLSRDLVQPITHLT